MPRSLLLPLVAAFALAACSKQADTGAAPAPETAATADSAAVIDDTTTPAEAELPAEAEYPAEESTDEATVPAEEPVTEEPVAEEPMDEEPMDESTVPTEDATEPVDSVPSE
jgi:hypothetical protein